MTENIWIDLQMSLVRPCQAARKPVRISVRQPSNGECSGGVIRHRRGLRAYLSDGGTGIACGARPSGRPWSTVLAASDNEGMVRRL
jgi:hypothetical protein